MINLIPPGGKKRVNTEYVTRALSLWVFLLACALLGGALLLVPTYVLLQKQIFIAGTSEDGGRSKGEEFEVMTKTLKETNVFAAQLSQSMDSVRASDILAQVSAALSQGVDLRGLSITDAGEGKGVSIIAQGTASTRQSLRAFLDKLKQGGFFQDAQVPISDLAPDTNLVFTATLKLKPAQ